MLVRILFCLIFFSSNLWILPVFGLECYSCASTIAEKVSRFHNPPAMFSELCDSELKLMEGKLPKRQCGSACVKISFKFVYKDTVQPVTIRGCYDRLSSVIPNLRNNDQCITSGIGDIMSEICVCDRHLCNPSTRCFPGFLLLPLALLLLFRVILSHS